MPARPADASIPGLLILLFGVGLSIATTCAPPPSTTVADTGTTSTGTPSVGFTVEAEGAVSLHAGETETRTVRVTLPESCLAEVPDYFWGHPTGWLQLGFDLDTGLGPGDTGWAPDTGSTDTGTHDTGAPDTGAPDTGTHDTGTHDTGTDTGFWDTGVWDTGRVDSGLPDTGAPTVDTGATADTGAPAVDTGAPADTGAPTVDTGATDTGAPTSYFGSDTGDSGATPDARVHVSVTRSDTSVIADGTFKLYSDTVHDAATDDSPFVACVRDTECVVTWQVAFTLVEGEAAHGTVDAHARIRMCSSGEPTASDIAIDIE